MKRLGTGGRRRLQESGPVRLFHRRRQLPRGGFFVGSGAKQFVNRGIVKSVGIRISSQPTKNESLGQKGDVMKSLVLVAVVFLFFLAGCSTLMRPVTSLPEFDAEPDNNVTILRNYNYLGSAVRFWPTVDGQEISGLFPKQHNSFKISPGKHSLGVQCWWSDDTLDVEIKENEQYNYMVSLDPFAFINPLACAEIEEISKSEAIDRLKKSTRIKTGHMSDCDGRSVLFESKPDKTCHSYAIP